MFRMNWMLETTIAAAWLIFLATYAVVALSGCGTNAKSRLHRTMSEFEGERKIFACTESFSVWHLADIGGSAHVRFAPFTAKPRSTSVAA
jgi:hypothetical protein